MYLWVFLVPLGVSSYQVPERTRAKVLCNGIPAGETPPEKNSGKVDVAYQPRLASAFEQCQQMSAFSMPTLATNEDNDPGIGLFGCQRQEVVPIAGDQDQTVFADVIEDLNVGGPNRKDLPKFGRLIAFMA
jgi:hypothetical protein